MSPRLYASTFVAGDRGQRHVAKSQRSRTLPPAMFSSCSLWPSMETAFVIEAVDQIVAAGLDDVGAEQARGAVEVAHVHVEQRAEIVAFVQQLHARRAVVVAFERSSCR